MGPVGGRRAEQGRAGQPGRRGQQLAGRLLMAESARALIFPNMSVVIFIVRRRCPSGRASGLQHSRGSPERDPGVRGGRALEEGGQRGTLPGCLKRGRKVVLAAPRPGSCRAPRCPSSVTELFEAGGSRGAIRGRLCWDFRGPALSLRTLD